MTQLLNIEMWGTLVAIVAGGLVIGLAYGFLSSAISTIHASLTQ
ncbi:hypothetical protein [Streptomyces sp. NPDC059371]